MVATDPPLPAGNRLFSKKNYFFEFEIGRAATDDGPKTSKATTDWVGPRAI